MERIDIASKFVLQSPPGEINDVLNDVRDIISDDDALQTGIRPALREYNLAQFVTADVPGANHLAIVSDAGRVRSAAPSISDAAAPSDGAGGGDVDGDGDLYGEDDGEREGDGEEKGMQEEAAERFVDPKSKMTFLFDHLRLEASDPQPAEVNEEAEPFRAAVEAATETYLANHFHDGVSSVFAAPDASTRFIIQIVANKYNPQNYWSGRWRSEYIVDTAARTVDGRLLVNVHYYEQGNVQLSTSHSVAFPLPPGISTSPSQPAAAQKILAQIADEEARYQGALGAAYHELAERTFKGLRRALPLTRQKLDWDKVLGYKLGAELTASRGVLGGS